ncbi:MAG TPA: cytochrome c [Clostridia bacterium]|nr:cytochrome c [Clostridia bacterium]
MKKTVILLVFAMAAGSAIFAADGAAIYKSKCAMCHGADGSKSNPNMRALNSAEVQKQTEAQLAEATAKGKGKMPAYASKLSPEEIKAVAAYMKTLK